MNKDISKLSKKQKMAIVEEYIGTSDFQTMEVLRKENDNWLYGGKRKQLMWIMVGMSLAWLLLTCILVALY